MSTRQGARGDERGHRGRGQEAELRDRARLSQERRLKQATQFLHKDSADLLPLDSLKRLGTSKDLQPHSVIQRRLVEGNQSRLQRESPDLGSRTEVSRTEMPVLLVSCKHRLEKRVLQGPGGHLAPGPPIQVEQLELQLGQETVACSARVVDVESPEFCLGLQTLLSLKSCIDLDRGVLRLKAPFPELPFLPLYQDPGQ
ncbi:nuclear receptor-interacting protein 2 [Echinops telfairi]|uniref:Nuclear receptor-interacting protein 2 n=1 Tax=Echinops telfairi TaxID=9371 RepID=A0ABM0IY82_ECHTE|nr:nuclear receptor-interacting protein 2 [Echinops telfairi]